jgi:4-hydroxyacetophenone monooxygenase
MAAGISATRHDGGIAADAALIRAALAAANLNVLRVALFHQTGDARLAAMRTEARPVRGGALVNHVLVPEDRAKLLEIAAHHLSGSGFGPPPHLTRPEAARLMEMFTGRALPPGELEFGYEDLALAEFPRDVQWPQGARGRLPDDFMVAIVGAGISGIAAAVQLERLGIPYRIIERFAGIGGTWHLNDYPEARVDIPSYLYQYKFEKHYPWRNFYADQAQIRDYLAHVADKYGVSRHITYSTDVSRAEWQPQTARWELSLAGADGQGSRLSANVLIACSGVFSTPNLPDIPGIDAFAGAMFHTTNWDHGFDYRGKKVALIGTGSTGCQLAPAVAAAAASLTIYQRTPNWITPVKGYREEVPASIQWLMTRLPAYWHWLVYSTYAEEQEFRETQVLDEDWIAKGGRVNATNDALRRSLSDYVAQKLAARPELIAHCIPDYPPMARRLVVDNGWYDTLLRDNVTLESNPIERFTATGIRTRDGRERDFDLVVLGAGFKVSDYLAPAHYIGRDGVTPYRLWARDGARAHLGLTMPGFPNFLMFYGPNGQARGGGFHSWAEVFARYAGQMIVHMVDQGRGSFETRQDVFDRYNAGLDAAMKRLLWETEGKSGYYVNEHGRSGLNMPWTMHEYHKMVRAADPSEFHWH